MAGAALAGDADLVAEARVWQRRHGGNLVTMHPFVVSAELGLDERLERVPVFAAHARDVAAALATVDGVEIVPDPPQSPLFHVLLRGGYDELAEAALAVAEERKVFLFGDPSTTTSPTWHRHEVMVGEATLRLRPEELRDLYAEVVERAAASSASRQTQIESSPPRQGRPSNHS
jgi:threonine aldolase